MVERSCRGYDFTVEEFEFPLSSSLQRRVEGELKREVGMGKTILVVDDEEEILHLCERKLTDAGYRAITAENGMEALNKAKSDLPDMILMDIMLPDIDGSEVVLRLKGEPRTEKIPVIFLSGIIARSEGPKDGINVGGEYYDVIAKPIQFNELLAYIKQKLA